MRSPGMTYGPASRRALLVLLAVPALALAGCSRHTALTVRADLVPFMNDSQTTASGVPYRAGALDVKVPLHSDPNPGYAVDLTQLGLPSGAASGIEGVALDVTADITPTATVGAGSLSFYIAPSGSADAFLGTYRVAQVATPQLPAGQTTAVTAHVQLDSQADPTAFQRIQSGAFAIGARIQAPASGTPTDSLDVTLTHLVLSISLPPGWGLP